jgi:predicted ribosomally synthesized peptide with nif11-like leader
MSEEQLSALLAKLKDDAGLREKLQAAGDLDSVEALAKEAGFDVSKADWLRHQAKQILDLNDGELESVAGGAYATQCVQTLTATWEECCNTQIC